MIELIFLFLFFVSLSVFIFVSILLKQNKESMERKEQAKKKLLEEQEERNQEILLRLSDEVCSTFHVWLENVHENHTQDEIIRCMDILAHQVAEACVNQDKFNRGEKESYSLGQKTYLLKIKWSNARKLALQIAPELENRLPHFSEFEPLKSYNEEHLLKKKVKSK